MGKGKPLDESEKGKIKAYRECGHSILQISKNIKRSRKVITSYLNNEDTYGKNMKGRPSSVITAADKRIILRHASNSHDSAAKIKEKTGVKACVRTVQRVISNAKHIKRLKLKKKTPLNQLRKMQRLVFCRSNMTWTKEWERVVFSDEKKFNLEGPDGYAYYFHDLRKEEHTLDRLHSRAGGVMVWGAITYFGTIELQFLTSRMNAIAYKGVLNTAFPAIKDIFGPLKWKFQQDNAPIHTARIVKSWIEGQNVELLTWPPYSPDLNIIENVWGWLARKVYESGRQYSTEAELIEGIKRSWQAISLNYLQKLYDSLPKRMYEVILNRGGSTHY